MEKKIPVKTLYLLLLIGIGFAVLGIGSTYALFTMTAEISNPISLKSNLTYSDDVIETIEVDVPAGEIVSSTLNVTNSSDTTLNYTVWYLDEGYDIEVGTSVGNATGSLATGSSTSVTVDVLNNSSSTVTVILGVSSSSDSVVLSNNMRKTDEDVVKTSVSDFIYVLGSETSVLSEMEYDGNTVYFPDIEIAENEVLLLEYTGTSPNVNVPDTYIVNGTEYNVTLLSYHYHYNYDNDEEIEGHYGVFYNNTIIETVILGDNIKLIDSYYDYDDTGSQYVEENNAILLFYNCSNLKSVNKIPSTVTNMYHTFSGCTSLIKAPVIPSSVTNMFQSFVDCTNLVNPPEIPSSVVGLGSAFSGCTSLIKAPVIPSSVTNMYGTFSGCTSLTGIVLINATGVTNVTNIFYGTSKAITVEVPADSTTYTNIGKLTTSNGMPNNVTLVGVTPLSDFDYYIDTYDYYGTNVSVPEGQILLTKYNGTSADIYIPDIYVVEGVEYTPIMFGDGPNGESTFAGNSYIERVGFANDVLFADIDNEEYLVFNSMSNLFLGCENLISAPTIPSSITNMTNTFAGCINLTGTVRINASGVIKTDGIFIRTSKQITVEVPADSTTYNTFSSVGLPNNVTLSTFTTG